MKEYFKSLFPFRWMFVVIFIVIFELLISMMSISNIWWHFANILYWFSIDFSFGLGREEPNGWRNLFGISTTLLVIWYLITLL